LGSRATPNLPVVPTGHVAEILGHVPEIAGHDAETVGHVRPKYPIANGMLKDAEAQLEHPQLRERNRYRIVETGCSSQDMFVRPVTIPWLELVMGQVPAVGEHTVVILAKIATRPRSRRSGL
jgi:hypothetical protein